MIGQKSKLLATGAVLALLATTTIASAQSVRLLGDFRDWSAYTTSQGASKLCFVLTKPQNVSPTPDGFTQGYLYLTHRPGENLRNEFNFVAGYELAPETEAKVTIGGNSYELFVESDAAWLDDPAQSDSVAGNMRAGSSMSIQSTTAQGVAVTQTFSLSGVTAASRAIDRECS